MGYKKLSVLVATLLFLIKNNKIKEISSLEREKLLREIEENLY